MSDILDGPGHRVDGVGDGAGSLELRPVARRGTALLLLLALILLVGRVILALGRDFDPDELQHMHGGYLHARGQRPFVDYFEHHSPWTTALLSWLIDVVGPGWGALMVGRVAAALLGIAGLIATYALVLPLARVRGGSRNAPLVALIVQATVVTAIDKGIEIRPDVPAALLFTLALLGAFSALRAGGRFLPAAMGGFCLGCGLMFTPKLAFGALGLGVGALLFIGLHASNRGSRLARLAALVAMSTVPPLLTFLWLHSQDLFEPFWRDVVIGPLGWKQEVSPEVHLSILVRRNPLAMGAGIVGWFAMLCRGIAWRREVAGHAEPAFIIVPVTATAIAIGWFLVPVPWPQFLMPLWPLLACGAAELFSRFDDGASAVVFGGAVTLVAALLMVLLALPVKTLAIALGPPAAIAVAGAVATRSIRHRPGWMGWVATALAVVLLSGVCVAVQPNAVPYGALWLLFFAFVVAVPSSARMRAVAFVTVCSGPVLFIGKLLQDRPIAPFRAEFDLVMESTEPDDRVLTGWRGCAVFRPHAYRYFFLHDGVLQMLTEAQRGADVLEALLAHPPALAVRDLATRALGDEVQRYLDENYEATGVGDLWVRSAR